MLLSNEGRMTSCAEIAIQIPKTYIYPLFFRVLWTTIATSGLAKIKFKVRQVFTYLVFYLLMKNLYFYNLYDKNGI